MLRWLGLQMSIFRKHALVAVDYLAQRQKTKKKTPLTQYEYEYSGQRKKNDMCFTVYVSNLSPI